MGASSHRADGGECYIAYIIQHNGFGSGSFNIWDHMLSMYSPTPEYVKTSRMMKTQMSVTGPCVPQTWIQLRTSEMLCVSASSAANRQSRSSLMPWRSVRSTRTILSVSVEACPDIIGSVYRHVEATHTHTHTEPHYDSRWMSVWFQFLLTAWKWTRRKNLWNPHFTSVIGATWGLLLFWISGHITPTN